MLENHGTETNNQELNGTGTDNQEETRTFTQEEVDAIVLKRVGKEKARYADYDELKAKAEKYDESQDNRTELQKIKDQYNELQSKYDSMVKADSVAKIRRSVSKDTGVPENLLTAETEEDCKAQAKAILDFAKPKSYPGVPNNKMIKHDATSNTDMSMREFAQQIFKRGE